jgi:hypothetical protein
MDENKIKQIIREELRGLLGNKSFIFQNNLQIFDGKNIQLGKNIGTKIGTAYNQKVGFYTLADQQFPYSRSNSAGLTGRVFSGSGAAAKVDTCYYGTDSVGNDAPASENAYTVGDIVTALKFIGILAKDS